MRIHRLAPYLLMALLMTKVSAMPVIHSLHLSRSDVPKYDVLTIALDLTAQFDNPFDPEEASVSARFVSPKGEACEVDGFYSQDYSRGLVDNKEKLEPVGTPHWAIRFAPNETGEWKFVVAVKDATGIATKSGEFRAVPSHERGFIRRSAKSPYYLRYDDGSPYFAIGEDTGWANGGRGTYDYDDWFGGLGKSGANWGRVWMVSWNMGLEWTPLDGGGWGTPGGFHGLGRYSLDNAWRVDAMLSTARKNGVAVMLTFGTYGDLKDDPGYFGEQAWDKNPYNAKNGGPSASPADFWTNPKAKAFFKRKLRYIVARYGSSVAIQSWEFMNEINPPAPWVAEMSEYLHQIDPYRHLVSHSFGNDAIWKLSGIDFTQDHPYGDGGMDDSAPVILSLNRELTTKYKKPHMISEFGIDWKKSDGDYDPKGLAINLHNGLWASTMSRGMGGAAIWYWDSYVHPLNLYREFASLSKFAKRIPWPDLDWTYLDARAVQTDDQPETFDDYRMTAGFGWGKPSGDGIYDLKPDQSPEGGNVPQFLYSVGKADLRTTPVFRVHFKQPGRFLVHVSDVNGDNHLKISRDGVTALEQELPAGPGQGPWKSSQLIEEWNSYRATYDEDFGIDVPAGEHEIRVENSGGDWIEVTGYRLTNYRSSRFPAIRAVGLKSAKRSILWIQDEKSDWREAQKGTEPRLWKGIAVRLSGIPAGHYRVTWWDTRKGEAIRTDAADFTAEKASLTPPDFNRDIAADLERLSK